MEHNHSLINYATILVLPPVATLLTGWFRRGRAWFFVAFLSLMMMTASGIINLMVVKNDYQTMIDDAPRNQFLQWVRTQSPSGSVFISTHALYDPVTLAGRKNHLGQEYYVTVMGYDYWGRRRQINRWFSAMSRETVAEMKAENIHYIVIPKDRREYPYGVDEEKVKALLPIVYQDALLNVYAIE